MEPPHFYVNSGLTEPNRFAGTAGPGDHHDASRCSYAVIETFLEVPNDFGSPDEQRRLPTGGRLERVCWRAHCCLLKW